MPDDTTPPLTLYRVGEPSIGEAWPKRFSYSRSTGGLGTGVYAFRDREPAKTNEGEDTNNDGLFELTDVLQSPLQPQTRDAADALVEMSRVMALLALEVTRDKVTFEEVLNGLQETDSVEDKLAAPPTPKYTLTGGFGGQAGINNDAADKLFTDKALTILLNVPGLNDRYGLETRALVKDFVRATQRSYTDQNLADGYGSTDGNQPINYLLHPEYDGIAPLDGAGGNTGYHGCVVFRERVEALAGREVEQFETVEPEVLSQP